jgi:hypothetical protein
MNIKQIIFNSIEKMELTGIIDNAIEKEIKEAIHHIIKEEFSWYSDFGKALKEHIKNEIKIDLSTISLKEYNQTIINICRGLLEESLIKDSENQIKNLLNTFDIDIPENIKLSEIVEKIKDFWLADIEDQKEITCIYEKSDTVGGYGHFYVDPKNSTDKYSCSVQIAFHEIDGQPGKIRIYNIRYIGKDLSKVINFEVKWSLQTWLYRLYASQVAVVDDNEYVDVYYPTDYED